jgi:hypothetical protein
LNIAKLTDGVRYEFGHTSFHDFLFARLVLLSLQVAGPGQTSAEQRARLLALQELPDARAFLVELIAGDAVVQRGVARWLREHSTQYGTDQENEFRRSLFLLWLQSKRVECRAWTDPTVDMIGFKLQNLNLSGAKLNDGDLSHANLSNTILVGADLTRTTLHRACCRGANFIGAVLNDTQFSTADVAFAIGLPDSGET